MSSEPKRRWLIDGWKWWRHNHNNNFFDSVAMTFRSEIWCHFRDGYSWFWLRWDYIKRKHLWWTKHYKLIKEVEKLEKKLFGDKV